MSQQPPMPDDDHEEVGSALTPTMISVKGTLKPAFPKRQAAKYLGVAWSTLDQLLKREGIPAYETSYRPRLRYVLQEDLDRLSLQRNEARPVDE